MSTRTVSEARAELSEIIDEVEGGGEVTLTRHGKPVAVIRRPDARRSERIGPDLVAGVAELRRTLDEARHWTSPPGSISTERAEELVAAIRADRDDDTWTRLTQTP